MSPTTPHTLLLSFALAVSLIGAGCGDDEGSEVLDPTSGGASDVGADVPTSPDVAEMGTDVAREEDAAAPDAEVEADAVLADTGEPEMFEVGRWNTTLQDPARDREVGARIYYPRASVGVHALILVSHGGTGANAAENLLTHLGEHYAQRGFVAIHVGHRRSSRGTHVMDRPADVSFILDRLEDETLQLPETFEGSINTTTVGHTGHSAGAYTSHAVAGAVYPHGVYRDPRVVATSPISPQGVGGYFEGFDNGQGDNTWSGMDVPIFILVGGDELDTDGTGTFRGDGWRLQPFERYPDSIDRFQTLIPGQEHLDMGSGGSEPVKDFIAHNSRLFFDVYLRGYGDACAIGAFKVPFGLAPQTSRRPSDSNSALSDCP